MLDHLKKIVSLKDMANQLIYSRIPIIFHTSIYCVPQFTQSLPFLNVNVYNIDHIQTFTLNLG